ncbi:MAG: hypothetical protein QM649_06095 [Silvibacterium sp.]
MGIGFAVSRFGLFLRQFRLVSGSAVHSTGISIRSGVALVALGIVVNVAATVYHVKTIHALKSGRWTPGVSHPATALSLVGRIRCGNSDISVDARLSCVRVPIKVTTGRANLQSSTSP